MPSIDSLIHYDPLVTVEPQIESLKLKVGFKPSFKFDDNNTYVGIEVEVEGVPESSHVALVRDESSRGHPLWRNVEDGSLRNEGREFVSLPIKGENIEFAIDVLKDYLDKKFSGTYEFSERTSVHVHMNARDLTLQQLASYFITYLAVEPVLYNYCGGKRHKNIFCVPLNQCNGMSRIAGNLLNHLVADSNRCFDYIQRWKKYTGLNLAPLRNYGTIEFRHMVGTIDPDVLCNWINMILSIRTYCKKTPYKTILDKVLALNTSSEYALFLQEVFGDKAELMQFPSMQRRMEEAVSFIKDCVAEPSQSIVDKLINEFVKDEEKQNKSSLLLNAVSLKFVKVRPKDEAENQLEKVRMEWNVVDDVEATGAVDALGRTLQEIRARAAREVPQPAAPRRIVTGAAGGATVRTNNFWADINNMQVQTQGFQPQGLQQQDNMLRPGARGEDF